MLGMSFKEVQEAKNKNIINRSQLYRDENILNWERFSFNDFLSYQTQTTYCFDGGENHLYSSEDDWILIGIYILIDTYILRVESGTYFDYYELYEEIKETLSNSFGSPLENDYLRFDFDEETHELPKNIISIIPGFYMQILGMHTSFWNINSENLYLVLKLNGNWCDLEIYYGDCNYFANVLNINIDELYNDHRK
jgi:hypothetical protein